MRNELAQKREWLDMERFRRVMVCIDRPERDAGMLEYAGGIVRLATSKEIHFLHVETEPDGPPGDTEPESPAPPPTTREVLRALAAEHLKGHGKEDVICKVVSGSPLLEVLRYAADKEIDLIIIGRGPTDEETEEEAVLARRATRKSTCSVLVLPIGAPAKNDRILVPVRDSKCSANAASVACDIAASTEADVICLNVYQVHGGYLRVGTTLEEHTAILESWAHKECENLLKRVDTGSAAVSCKCLPDLHDRPVPVILEAVADERADLVVIGARGRTGAAGVLLGKVTEKLIQQSPVPVLAVKKTGECIGLLRALLEISG